MDQLRFEIDLIGKSRSAIAQLTTARQIDLQVRQLLAEAQKTGLALNSQEVDRLRKQAKAFKANTQMLEAVKADRQAIVDLFSGVERAVSAAAAERDPGGDIPLLGTDAAGRTGPHLAHPVHV